MFKKIKIFTLFCMLCILTVSLGCESKSAEVSTRPINTDQSASILTYKLPDMEKVKIKRDIVYEEYNELAFDVYYPLKSKDISKTPTVILVHGIANDGNLKDAEVYKAWGKVIAVSGFTAITFNWRPSLSLSRDVPDLIEYIRKNATELNINSENISVFAFSAGVLKGVKDAVNVNTGFIKSIVAYYGQIDESILTMKTNLKSLPFFIAMGADDNDFPPNINDNFINQGKAMGCSITNIVHPKAGHAFDLFNDDDTTKNIIDKTLEFIERNSN